MAQPSPVDDTRMPLLEHLRELRSRLLICVWTLLPACVIGFVFANDVFDLLAAPMDAALKSTGRGTLAITEAMEGFVVQMKVAGLTGVFLASPVLSFQIWRFVAPALYDSEKRTIVPLATASTGLFVVGAIFCYRIVFQYGFPFFLEMNGENVSAVLSINSYLGMVTTLILAFGLSFQLPIGIYFAARLGLVNARDLIRGFRYAVVLIFLTAAVLTPSPDAFSQALMAGPLLGLYVIGIGVAAIFTTKK